MNVPFLPQLDCLLHLPLTLFTPSAHSRTDALKDLILPVTDDALSCLKRNHDVHTMRLLDPNNRTKFCLVRLSVDIARFMGVESGTGIRAGLSAGVCLPESCSTGDLSQIATTICALPSCAVLQQPDLVEVCGNAQVVLCGPINRLRFEHNFTLDCVRDAPPDLLTDVVAHTWTELRGTALEAKLREYTRPFHTAKNEPLLSYAPDPVGNIDEDERGASDVSLSRANGVSPPVVSADARRLNLDGETLLSMDEMRALLDCGSGSFRALRGQMLSAHSLQQFGHFDDCDKDGDDFDAALSDNGNDEDHYCFVRFLGLLGQGRCVPRACHSRDLSKLLSFPCDFSEGAGERRFGGRSCLDFLNLIPLDLCLSAQMLGCGGKSGMSQTFEGASMINETFSNAIFHPSSDQMLQLRAFVQSAISPLLSPSITSSFEMRNDKLSSAQVGATLPSVETLCNYDSHSLASEVGLTLPIVLASAFFLVLPFLAFLRRAFAPHKDQPKWIDSTPPPTRMSFTRRAAHHSNQLISCFDLKDNYKSFLRGGLNVYQGEYPHLAGMRVLSMIWIILGHTFTSAFFGTMVGNLRSSLSLVQMLDFQIVMSGVFAVDSFFFFSGFLFSAYGNQRIRKTLDLQLIHRTENDKLGQFLVYARLFFKTVLHRYLRLAGLYFFLLAIWIFLVPHIASGPMAPVLVSFVLDGTNGGCRKNLWTNLLFINNLVPYNGLPDCMGWSWYLANDFQFFVVSLLLLLIRHKSHRAFRLCVSLIFLGSYVSSAVMILQTDVRVSRLSFSFRAKEDSFMVPLVNDQHFYFRPWFRIPPYLIGLMFGLAVRDSRLQQVFARLLEAKAPQKPEVQKSLLEAAELTSPQPSDSPILVLHPHALSDAILGGIASRDEEPTMEKDETETDNDNQLSSASNDEPLTADRKRVMIVHLTVIQIMLILIYLPYLANNKSDDDQPQQVFPNSPHIWWPRWADMLYGIFSRSLWGLCIGWFIISLATAPKSHSPRQGLELTDPITKYSRRLLSQKLLCFTSGLVYAVYLIHPGIQQTYYAADRGPLRMARLSGYATTIGWVIVSFALAFPCVVMIEIALVKLTTLLGL